MKGDLMKMLETFRSFIITFQKHIERRYHLSVFCVLVLALALRIGVTATFVGLNSPPDLEAQPDQLYYENIAYNLARGNGYKVSSDNPQPTAIVVPGTSLTLLPIYWSFGRSFALGRLWWYCLSVLACLGVALTVQQVWNKPAAFVAAGIMAFYPNHFYYAMHFGTETPYTFYMAAALACTIAALRKRSTGFHIVAGMFWGAAALTRAQIVLMMPLAFCCVLLAWRSERRWMFFRAWIVQTSFLLLMLSPWLLRNAIVIGEPVLSTFSGHTFLLSHNDLIFNDPAYRKYRGSWLRDVDKLKELYPLEGETY
ncbi:hypothetical protein GF339_11110 [candidate division KSB3 bacterium]|uniref:Glycosyltransferase RgtA/B/C/D-like domain-containing protein n=1 Tax=candidate division KSB3 bacterium TaxID=2044937 RepID=A0A9D5Q5Y5_9BACT|nr:hypothetical protein [candidate division KSB3 bacterium]MBD3325125.1 hypothetical protein [candidate division KSB3 bacterium]